LNPAAPRGGGGKKGKFVPNYRGKKGKQNRGPVPAVFKPRKEQKSVKKPPRKFQAEPSREERRGRESQVLPELGGGEHK